jgi:transposase
MLADTLELPDDVAALKALVRLQAERIKALGADNAALRALIFGHRSERSRVIFEGEQLFLDLQDLGPPIAANDVSPSAEAKGRPERGKAKRNLGRLPSHLPRIEEIIEPKQKSCPCCAGALHWIGQDMSEALDVVPAIVRVLRTIRPKYACRACETGVFQHPARSRLFDGGMASTSVIASVAVWKFAWFMPLSRQASMLAGQGLNLDRSTLTRWMKKAAWWLKPLYERQLKAIHSAGRVFCDETPLPVRRSGLRRTHKGQFWAHVMDDRPWGGPSPPAVVYVFSGGRGHREIKKQLQSYQGLLQVDGYVAYKKLEAKNREPGPIHLAFCLAHARRKFVEAHKKTGSRIAADIIGQIAAIYAIEAEIRGQSADERRAVRQSQTAPLVSKLKETLETELKGLAVKSDLAKAIRYTIAHWKGLIRFLDDGRLEVDNNTVERTMRPIALGRRNHLFAGDDGGAETWSILASLLATAKLNGVDPFTWLNDVLDKLVSGAVKANDLDRLLVWNWKAARETARLAA